MTPRCQPGDLAIVIRDVDSVGFGHRFIALRAGTVLRVVAYDPTDESWSIEEPVPGQHPTCCGTLHWLVVGVADSEIRPLRDSDGDDETLRWVGKPQPQSFAQAMWHALGRVCNS